MEKYIVRLVDAEGNPITALKVPRTTTLGQLVRFVVGKRPDLEGVDLVFRVNATEHPVEATIGEVAEREGIDLREGLTLIAVPRPPEPAKRKKEVAVGGKEPVAEGGEYWRQEMRKTLTKALTGRDEAASQEEEDSIGDLDDSSEEEGAAPADEPVGSAAGPGSSFADLDDESAAAKDAYDLEDSTSGVSFEAEDLPEMEPELDLEIDDLDAEPSPAPASEPTADLLSEQAPVVFDDDSSDGSGAGRIDAKAVEDLELALEDLAAASSERAQEPSESPPEPEPKSESCEPDAGAIADPFGSAAPEEFEKEREIPEYPVATGATPPGGAPPVAAADNPVFSPSPAAAAPPPPPAPEPASAPRVSMPMPAPARGRMAADAGDLDDRARKSGATLAGGAAQPLSKLEEVITRRATVRHFRQMNPLRVFPLAVFFSEHRLQKLKSDEVAQTEGKRAIQVTEKDPWVEIVPHFPGCLVTPERIRLNVKGRITQGVFAVTPLAEGEFDSARVEIYHAGEKVEEIHTPCRVVKQTAARVAVAAGFVGPVLSAFFDILQLEQGSAERNPVAWAVRRLVEICGGWNGLGLVFGGLSLAAAFVFYMMRRPKKADPVTSMMAVDEWIGGAKGA